MKKIILAISIFISLGMQSNAQDKPEKKKLLKEVAIKSDKKNTKELGEFKRHAQTTEVLTEEDLNRNNPMFIEQSMNTVAGVQMDL